MVSGQFPYGSGFGSFEDVYKTVEPSALLSYRYLNQAHNDWAQFVIEGGLPGLFLLILLVAWLGWRFIEVWISPAGSARDLALVSLFALAVLGLASFVDYPLRTPAMGVFAIALAVMVERWAQGRDLAKS